MSFVVPLRVEIMEEFYVFTSLSSVVCSPLTSVSTVVNGVGNRISSSSILGTQTFVLEILHISLFLLCLLRGNKRDTVNSLVS